MLLYFMTNDLRLHDNASFDYFMISSEKNKRILFYIDPIFRGERFNKRAFGIFRVAVEQLIVTLKDIGVESLVVNSNEAFNNIVKGNTVIISEDTSPFSQARLDHIKTLAAVVRVFDTKHFLDAPAKKYKVFSAYYKDRLKIIRSETGYKTLRRSLGDYKKIKLYNDAIETLKKFDPDKYSRTSKASIKSRSGSTNISWALARGIVSTREVYEHCRKICKEDDEFGPTAIDMIVRELIFRDFYSRATKWFMKDYDGRFRNVDVKWKIVRMDDYIKAIRTAPEVIKVAYYSLISTGRLSNYGRMLFATWTYDIGADWTLGELLFARELLDYDFSSNHWNWAHHSIQGLNYQWPAKKFNVESVKIFT